MERNYVSLEEINPIVNQFEKCKEDDEDLDEEDRGRRPCIQLIGSFDLPHPDNRVEYDFWYSSENEEAMNFLADFEEYHYKYKEDVFFTPRIFSFECKSCDKETLNRDCFYKGKYCAHSIFNTRLSGQDILYENLRQKCLHNKLQKNSKFLFRVWFPKSQKSFCVYLTHFSRKGEGLVGLHQIRPEQLLRQH